MASSIVYLAHIGLIVLILSFDLESLALLLFGLFGNSVLHVPLAVAVVFIVRLVYLKLAANSRIPFVDGWLIQLSILSLYIGMFIIL